MSPKLPRDGGDPAVSVRNLVKRYGPVKAVEDLSFEITTGEVFAILGPNGAGKTTTIEILEGLRRPDSGEVRVLGRDPRRQARLVLPRIGVMLQEGGLYPGIRVAEAVRLFAGYYPNPRAADELIAQVGLAEHARRYVKTLSTGEKQRLSLALALVGRPELVFLDEPTAGMDPHGRAATWERVGALKAQGVTVILTTQLLDEAERLADRVAIIHRGGLVALGAPESFRTDRVEFTTDKDADVARIEAVLGTSVKVTAGGHHRIDSEPSPGLIAALAAELSAQGVLVTKLTSGGSLEETFLRLTAED